MAYSPAANTTGSAGLAHLQSVYYQKTGLDRLQKKFVFRDIASDDMLPKMSGKTVQFFRYSNFASNSTVTTEGTVGSSQSLTTKILSATVSQYTSFITVSDLLKDTALDQIVTAASDLLGYQAGLSVDTITRTVIDAQSASTNMTLLGAFARVADLRNAKSQLSAVDVEPFADNNMLVIAHPFTTYDIVNDPASGGLADIFKYTSPKDSALVKYEDRGVVSVVAGCKIVESTNVKVIAGSPNTYRMYIFGKGGVGAVDLEGRGPNKVKDPSKQRFKVNVIQGGQSIADPEGVIGAAVSYNFVFTVAILEGPAGIGGNYRYRTFDAPSSIG